MRGHLKAWAVRLILCHACVASAATLPVPNPETFDASGSFSGRVWNDLNRNGLQEEGEPGMANLPIYIASDFLIGGGVAGGDALLYVYYADANGNYSFSYSSTQSFYVAFGEIPWRYGISPVNVGADDLVDSDFLGFYYITNMEYVATSMDIGMFFWNTGIEFQILVNDLPIGTSVHVTNGATVTLTYHIKNTGETALSMIFANDVNGEDQKFILGCPQLLWPDEHMITTQVVTAASTTNMIEIFAFPVSFNTCSELLGYDPVFVSQPVIIIVDEWADELAIHSVGRDGRIVFTEIANVQNYRVDWSTNFIDSGWTTPAPPDLLNIPSIGPVTRIITSSFPEASGTFRLMAEMDE